MGEGKSHFDRLAAEYDRVFPAHITAHYLRKRSRFLGALLRGGIGLDVGCGTGTLMEALRPFGTVFGADNSVGMLRVLRQNGRGEAAACSIQMLPFADASFDVVFCVAVLHHVAEPVAVRLTIREMVRVARPGGALVIWDHNPRNPYWPSLMRRAPQDTGAERLIPVEEIARTLEECGVRDVRVTQSGFVPEFVPRFAMPCARAVEALLERAPFLRRFSAHNVIAATKGNHGAHGIHGK